MGLSDNMQTDPVSRLKLRQPVEVPPDMRLDEVIRKMREHQLGCAVVVNGERKPVGLFTEAMLRYLLAKTPYVMDEQVKTHMATQVPWVERSAPIALVLEAMETRNTRFLCVVDSEGYLVGLTGQKGLMEYIAEHFPCEVMAQDVGCQINPRTQQGA